MISIILSLIIIVVAAAAIGILTDRRIEECIPLTFLGTCLCLYVFYCLNLLIIGRIFVYILMASVVVLAVRKVTKNRVDRNWKNTVFTPAAVAFLLLAVFFYLFSLKLTPSVWDELRLWSAMPKAIHFSPMLQVGEGSLLYSTMQSYPPGMALLVYFLTSLQKGYYEFSPFFTTAIFGAALFLPALKTVSWRKWFLILPSVIIFLLIPLLLTINGSEAAGDWAYYYLSLFIDPVLGLLFGYGIFMAVNRPFANWFSAVNFALCLFMLPALKNTGAMYGGIVLLTAVVISAAEKQMQRKNLIKVFMSLVFLAASYFSWQLIINSKGTGEFISFNYQGLSLEKIKNVLSGIIAWGKLPFLWIALFFLAAGIVMTLCLKDISKKTAVIAGLGILAAALIFFYGYTSHYGGILSSIHRYTQTLTFAMFLYLLMRLVVYSGIHMVIKKSGMVTGTIIVVEILLCIGTVVIMHNYKNNQYSNGNYGSIREQINLYSEKIDADRTETSPAKCYLAMGGDIFKKSQCHETYYQVAIGTHIAIKNIWCDKLINSAVADPETELDEKVKIWEESLMSNEYDYVLVIDPDEEIKEAVLQIDPDVSVEGNMILGIEKAAENTPISFRIIY